MLVEKIEKLIFSMQKEKFDIRKNEELYIEGCRLLDLNKLEDAKKNFDEITQIDFDAFRALNKLGVIYAKNQNYDTAKAYFTKVLGIKPDYAPALVNLGSIENENGNLEAAANYYRQAIDSDKDYYYAYYNLAILYKRSGDYREYIDYMKQYRKCYKGNVNVEERGNIKQLYSKIFKHPIFILIGVLLLIIIWNIF